MKDLKLIDGDIQITNDLAVVKDDTELIQSIELLLSTYIGEFRYEPQFGVDYATSGFKMYTKENEQALKLAIQKGLEQEPRIQRLTDISTEFGDRVLTINLVLRKSDDTPLEMEVNVGV